MNDKCQVTGLNCCKCQPVCGHRKEEPAKGDLISRKSILQGFHNLGEDIERAIKEQTEIEKVICARGMLQGVAMCVVTIQSEPTAYDIDNVVRWLKDEEGRMYISGDGCDEEERLEKIVEIVKRGGTDEI